MLDQNTDRMWYVIGAVIIGAAIIFILNGTMPQLFASVGETFEKKADDVSAEIDTLTPYGTVNTGLVIDGDDPKGHERGGYHYTYGSFKLSEKINHGTLVDITLQLSDIKAGTTLIGVYATLDETDSDTQIEQVALIERDKIDKNGRVTIKAKWLNSRDLDSQQVRLYSYPNRQTQNAGFELHWLRIEKSAS